MKNSFSATRTDSVRRRIGLAVACVLLCNVSAAAVTGQLWYTTGNSFTPPPLLGHINSDGSGATIAIPNTSTSSRVVFRVAVDSAAGYYWVINNSGNSTDSTSNSLIEYRLSDNTQVAFVKLGDPSDQDVEDSLAVDPLHHVLYVAQWGATTPLSGIEKITYNSTTGAMTGGFGSPNFLVNNTNFTGLDSVLSMSIDIPNQKLYFSDNDNGYSLSPYHPTNAVFMVDLTAANPVPVQLTSNANVTGGFPTGPGVGSGGGTASTDDPNGLIGAVTFDPSTGLVYFLTSEFQSASATGGVQTSPAQDALWYVSSTGGANQVATKVTGVTLNYPDEYGGLSIDPLTRQIYITDENQTAINAGHVLVGQLSADGHSVSTISTFNMTTLTGNSTPDVLAVPEGTTFLVVPKLAAASASGNANGTTAFTVSPTANALDPTGGYLLNASVQISAGTFAGDGDLLTVNGQSSGTISGTSIVLAYNSTTETLTLTGYDTVAHYNAALSHVQYTSSSSDPTNAGAHSSRTLTWFVNNGLTNIPSGSQNTTTSSFTIVLANQPPVATLPVSSYSATEQVTLPLKNTGISVADPDGGSGSETATLSVDEGTLTVAAGTSGAVVTNSGTSSVTIAGTIAQINALLNTNGTSSVAYIDNSDNPIAMATLTLSINDNGNTGTGGPLTSSASTKINIAAVNDAPTISVPGAQSVASNTNLVLTGLVVADVDAKSGSETVTLGVLHGAVTVGTTGGATVTNSGTALVTVSGTITQINAALSATNNVVYRSSAGFGGAETLTATINDNGNTGTGGALSASKTVAITVLAVPVLAEAFGTSSIAVGGTTSLTFTLSNSNSSLALTGVGFSDALSAGLTIASPNGLSSTCSGSVSATAGSSSVALTGSSLSASASCSFSVNVVGGQPGSQSSTSSVVSSNEAGSGPAASATIAVVAPPTISATFAPSTIAPAASTTLTFTLGNPAANSVAQSGVAFTDSLPIGLVVGSSAVTNSCAGIVTATSGSTSISLSGGALSIAGTCAISVPVIGNTAGQYVNSTTPVSSTNGGSGSSASANLSVLNLPTITLVPGALSIPEGTTTSLTFTIGNNNTISLTGIAFSDLLPAGLVVATPNGISGSCGGGIISSVSGSSTIALSNATLAPSTTCIFSVNVQGTTAGVKTDSATVSATETGVGTTGSATLTVVSPATLDISFAAPSIPLNGSTSLSFTVTNDNASASLSGIGFADTLPAGLSLATPSGLSGSCGTGTITADDGTSSVSLTNADLLAGASCTFSVNVIGTAAGTQVNTISTVSSTEGGDGAQASATVDVIAAPTIAASFSPSTIAQAATTTLNFTLGNAAANSDALAGVAFTDTLPTGLVVGSSAVTNSCAGTVTATAGSTSIGLSGGAIGIGGTCAISVPVVGNAAGQYIDVTSAVASSNGGSGGTASASLSVLSGPTLGIAFAAPSIPLGTTTSLTFTVGNSNAAALSGVGFSDTLPAGLVVATPNGISGSCGGGIISSVSGSSTIALSNATLVPSTTCMFSVNVEGTTAGVKTDSATVSATETGVGTTGSATLTVVSPATLDISFAAPSIPLNGSTSLSFTVTNDNASASLSGIGFADTLPAGLSLATPSGLSGSCGTGAITADDGASSVSLTNATLLAGASCTFSVNVTGIAAGTQVNTISTISSTEGGDGAQASATIDVVAAPTIAASFSPSTIAQGATTTLTFMLGNPAANAVTQSGVAFTDTLPIGLAIGSSAGTNSCAGAVTATAGSTSIGLSGGTIGIGGTCAISVPVVGNAAGQYTAVTSAVASSNGGSGGTASASLSVLSGPTLGIAFAAPSIPLGTTTSLTFTVGNSNAAALSGVGFSDTLPAGLIVATPNGLSGSCGGGIISSVSGSSTIALSNATLAASTACTFSVNAQGTTAGVKTDSATVSATETGVGSTGSATLTVVSPPTLAIAFGASPILIGASTSLMFTVTNPSATIALSGIDFSDTLPAGLLIATPNGLTGSCGGGSITATAGASTISLVNASLPASGACTFALNVVAVQVGVQSDTTGLITSTEGGSGTSANASLTVNSTTTTTSIVTSPNPAVFGQSVLLSATLSGAFSPTGTIIFCDGGTTNGSTCSGGVVLCGGVVPLIGSATGGTASCSVSTLSVGTHNIVAGYSGDTRNQASFTASAANEIVNRAETITAITPPPTTALGTAVTVTSNVTAVTPGGGTPSGSVTIGDGTVSCTASLVAGTASCALTPQTPVGAHALSATYGGDANFVGSTASGSLSVSAAASTTSLTSSLNPSTFGQSVTFTATIAGQLPAGSVTFSDGANVLCTAVALTGGGNNPTAVCTALALDGGMHTISAAYTSADLNNSDSSGSLTQNVETIAGSVTITSSVNPSAFGQSVTFSVTVTQSATTSLAKAFHVDASPTGSVTFSDGATVLSTVAVDINGNASYATSALGPGSHTITAAYSGDLDTGAASASLIQVVNAPAVPAPFISFASLLALILSIGLIGLYHAFYERGI